MKEDRLETGYWQEFFRSIAWADTFIVGKVNSKPEAQKVKPSMALLKVSEL